MLKAEREVVQDVHQYSGRFKPRSFWNAKATAIRPAAILRLRTTEYEVPASDARTP